MSSSVSRQHGVDPARPVRRTTDDGRPWREVLSYSRRGSRFTPRQQAGWDAYSERFHVPVERVEVPGTRLGDLFDRPGPLAVEIGCGVGEATAALAAHDPATNVVALEVWMPGVADTLGRVGDAGLTNVRVLGVDAAWALEQLVEPGSLSALWTFFPDPWPKTRHHKRRLVQPGFASLAASRLAPEGEWRLATDWPDYAEQAREVLDAEPSLVGGVVPRFDLRPVTRFERKGLEKGRTITDLAYRRR